MTDLWNVKIVEWNRSKRILRLLLVRVYPDMKLPVIVGFFEMLLANLVNTEFSYPGLGYFGLNPPSDGQDTMLGEADFRGGKIVRVTPLERCGSNEPAVLRGREHFGLWLETDDDDATDEEQLAKTIYGLQCLYDVEVTQEAVPALDKVERCRGFEHTAGTATYEERKFGYSLQAVEYGTAIHHISPRQSPSNLHIPLAMTKPRAESIRAEMHERFGNPPYRDILQSIRDGQWSAPEDDFKFFIYDLGQRNVSDCVYNGNPQMTTRTAQKAAQEVMVQAAERMTPDLVAGGQLSDGAKAVLEDFYHLIHLTLAVAERLRDVYHPLTLFEGFLLDEKAMYDELRDGIVDLETGEIRPDKHAEAVALIKSEWNMT